MVGLNQLKSMPLEAIVQVVDNYPWFAAAQKILDEKMAVYAKVENTYADEDIAEILQKYMNCSMPSGEVAVEQEISTNSSFKGVGDYFSVEQYASVQQESVNWAREITTKQGSEEPIDIALDFDEAFCTETLAEIYADQGYYSKARNIYSKLILAYPEKSTYFAARIQKMDLKQ